MKKVLMMIPVILFITVIGIGVALFSNVDEDSLLARIPGISLLVAPDNEEQVAKGGYHLPKPGEFDSADTAIVASVDTSGKYITFLNKAVNKYYTLSYDGLSEFRDRHGVILSAPQLRCGDIMDVMFRRSNKYLVGAKVSQESWVRTLTNGFEINDKKNEIAFGREKLSLSDKMVILSGEDDIELQDLNYNDTVSLGGVGSTVYSISVDKGHGYLRLTGDEYFTGGFIEVGQRLFTKITGDMLITVPEGSYRVSVRNGRHGGSKETNIYRDEETILDVSDLKGEEIRTGNVFFTLTPRDASVYIDGQKIDTGEPLELEYGIHSMIVTAKGYETISQYLRVGQENANLNVTMDRDNSDVDADKNVKPALDNPMGLEGDGLVKDENGNVVVTDPAQKENPEENALYNALPMQRDTGATDSGVGTSTPPWGGVTGISTASIPRGAPTVSNTVSASSSGPQVKLSAPAGAEVYVDGSFVGVVPVSFGKQAGSHVISLRKNGYQTRSYTIQVDNEQADMQLSFSELEISVGN